MHAPVLISVKFGAFVHPLHLSSSLSLFMEVSPSSPHSSRRRLHYRIETRSLSYDLPAAKTDFLWRPPRHGVPCAARSGSRAILKNVSCEALPGELLAIAGPSGAGKTTLLSVMAGEVQHPSRVRGRVLLNGRPMDASRFRRVSGYVTQDDALFPLLTVQESLTYSAMLRLRATRGAAAARVAELMKELGLERVAGSMIGSGRGRGGLSGGERRRVSIGIELVRDPAALLLDEPTSGLDSASSLHVVKLLKSMAAAQSKTIVLTVHQPSFRILELFDRVVLISGGAVRHKGSMAQMERRLKDSGHCVPPRVNVLEYAIDALSGLDTQSTAPQPVDDPFQNKEANDERISYANSHFTEVVILTCRFFKNASRTREIFASRMIQSVVAGVVLGTLFANATSLQTRVGFFAFTLSFLLSSTTEGLPVFLRERRILRRETSRGAYRVSSYVTANAAVFAPLLLAAALLYSIPVYWLAGLRREADGFLYFILVIWLVMLMANSFVACFSAVAPNFVTGSSVISGLMGSFFLFSGYFISEQSIPKYWVFMHYLSLFKYPFDALVVNEYGGARECLERGRKGCSVDGGLFLRRRGLEETQRWRNLWVMLGFVLGYRVLCFLILWLKMRR